MSNLSFYLILAMFGIMAACSPSEPKSGNTVDAPPTTDTVADMTLDELLTQHQEYERVQLEKTPSGHLQMDVSLNGVNGKFILDTGAGASVLEEKRKSAFSLEALKSKIMATGAGGGGIGMQVSAGNTLQIGQLEIENFSIYLMSLDHVNKAFLTMKLEEIDGIIGSDILTAKRGVIDYTNLILYLRK